MNLPKQTHPVVLRSRGAALGLSLFVKQVLKDSGVVVFLVCFFPIAINTGVVRKGLFISVGGTRGPKLFEPAKATVKIFFKTLDFTYSDELLFRGIDEKGAIAQHPTALSEAFLAGQRLAQE